MQLESVAISEKASVLTAVPAVPAVAPDSPRQGNEPNNEKKPVELADLKKIAADIQKYLKAFHSVDLQFSVHQASGQVMVRVTDEDTGKVIREIPSRELLDLSVKLEEMMGLIFDKII